MELDREGADGRGIVGGSCGFFFFIFFFFLHGYNDLTGEGFGGS